jgi:hypothetical protein
MAEHSTRTTSKDSRHRPRHGILADVADGVYALVDPDQLAGADAPMDDVLAHANPEELRAGDVSVLPAGQPRERLIDLSRIARHIDQ